MRRMRLLLYPSNLFSRCSTQELKHAYLGEGGRGFVTAVKAGYGADMALWDECDVVAERGSSRIIHGVVKGHYDDLAGYTRM